MGKIASILIVDDSEVDLFLHETMIKSYCQNIEVFKAHDGQECLQLLQKLETPPQLVLLDINMPGMNGFEFLDAYTSTESTQTNIVMLSSSSHPADKEKALSFECVKDYILKPLTVDHIEKLQNFGS